LFAQNRANLGFSFGREVKRSVAKDNFETAGGCDLCDSAPHLTGAEDSHTFNRESVHGRLDNPTSGCVEPLRMCPGTTERANFVGHGATTFADRRRNLETAVRYGVESPRVKNNPR
jgi:hypothetical protein